MLKIEFVSDIACPWCAVGLNALERALERLGDEVPVELVFEPFELNPQMGSEGEDAAEHLSRKYGLTAGQLAANRENLHQRGAAVGFAFGSRTRVWNTFDAHRLLLWAAEAGGPAAQRALKHALLEAYHAHDRNPGDHEVLAAAAEASGLDAQRAREVLGSEAYAPEVRRREAHWQGLGIHSVPSAIVDGRWLIQGGQPPEAFESALREIAARRGAEAA
jgi:predicted DsbA family dithiol-disulfide isomerase